MIRVLQIIGLMNRGGAETMIMNLYRNIDKTKIQFDFVVHTTEKCAFDDEIIKNGGKIYRVPRYKIYNHFKYVRELKKIFKEHQEYSIIHCHINSTASIITNIAKKYKMKTIVHSHSTAYQKGISGKYKEFLQKKMKKNDNSKVDFNFACSNEAGKWLYGNNKFKVINNAIESDIFIFNKEKRQRIRENYDIKNKFVIGHVGRFSKIKNHEFLIDIFEEILKIKKDSVLILVGDGENIDKIKLKVKKLNIEDKVIFTGIQSNINEILMGMDILLLPSLFEGLPVTLVEAQATGLKCIISDNISQEINITELITTVSLQKEPKIWAQKVIENKDYLRENMQKDIIRKGYDIKSTVKELEKIYLGNSRNK